MNTFLTNNRVHGFLGGAIVVAFFVLAYISLPHLFTTQKTEANSHANTAGWAYAAGGGNSNNGAGVEWVSFNSDNCDTDNNNFLDVSCGGNNTSTPVVSYGVNVNLANKRAGGIGIFTGHAYAEDIGYISFNRSETGAPPAGQGADYSLSADGAHTAHVAWVSGAGGGGGQVTGWARALAACDSIPCTTSGPGANSGGWDGWIKLSNGDSNVPGTPHAWQTAPNTPGVSITAGVFSGKAWGGSVIGWMDFAPTSSSGGLTPGVTIVDPVETCSESEVTNWSPCIERPNFCSPANPGDPIPGEQSGRCPSPSTVSLTRTCVTGAFCPLAPPPPVSNPCPFPSTDPFCSIGDGRCSKGENPKNSPRDCKAKWWQF